MLDHLHVEDDIEAFAAGSELLGGGHPVIDCEFLLGGMDVGGLDVALGGVDADNLRPEAGHRLGQEPAAAADVEEAEALEGAKRHRVEAKPGSRLLADIGQPDGIELVKHAEFAGRIPPLCGN
jgi:hypothetical protein